MSYLSWDIGPYHRLRPFLAFKTFYSPFNVIFYSLFRTRLMLRTLVRLNSGPRTDSTVNTTPTWTRKDTASRSSWCNSSRPRMVCSSRYERLSFGKEQQHRPLFYLAMYTWSSSCILSLLYPNLTHPLTIALSFYLYHSLSLSLSLYHSLSLSLSLCRYLFLSVAFLLCYSSFLHLDPYTLYFMIQPPTSLYL